MKKYKDIKNPRVSPRIKHFTKENLLSIKEYVLPDTYLRDREGRLLRDSQGHKILAPKRSPSFIFNTKEGELGITCRVKGNLIKSELAYLAPGSLYALFLNRQGKRRDNIFVTMGEQSNIQEVRDIITSFRHQKISIILGDRCSIAHGVKIQIGCTNADQPIRLLFGNNVFIGINSSLLGRITIGNNTSVGFNTTLKDNVTIGDNVIIGDGAIIEENVVIPHHCVVLGGTTVTTRTVQEKNIMPIHAYLQLKEQTPENLKKTGVLRYTTPKDLLMLGNMYDFLLHFNDIVISDNQMFPVLNKLLTTYHPENIMPEKIHGGPTELIHVQYPRNIHAFMTHYLREAAKKKKDMRYTIKKYTGACTETHVDHATVFEGGTVRLYGDINIERSTIGIDVVLRGDEGGTFEIINSNITYKCVSHAQGHKRIVHCPYIGPRNVIHGVIDLEDVVTDQNTLLHNVTAKHSNIGQTCSIVEANLEYVDISERASITGHLRKSWEGFTVQQKPISIKYASLGERVKVRYNTRVEGIAYEEKDTGETKAKKTLFIGKDTEIGHDVIIRGTRSVGEDAFISDKVRILHCGHIGNRVFIGKEAYLSCIQKIADSLIIPAGYVCTNQKKFDQDVKRGVIRKEEG